MLYGDKNSSTQSYGSKVGSGVKYGAKYVAKGLGKVNSLAVPALALSGMGGVAAGLKATEGLARGISNL